MVKKITFLIVLLLTLHLSINKVQAYQEYKVGDKITYNGIDFYVIMNSKNNENYVELMKETPFTADDIYKYATAWINSNNTDTVALVRLTDQTYPYDQQEFKSNIDSWVEREFGNDAVNVDGYKARLLNMLDAQSLGFTSGGGCAVTYTIFNYEAKDHVLDWSSQEICNNNQCYKKYTFNSTTYGNTTYRTCDYNSTVDTNGDTILCDAYNNETSRHLLDFLIPHPNSYCAEYYNNPTYLETDRTYNWLSNSRFWTMVYRKVGESNWLYFCNSNQLYYSTGNVNDRLEIRPVVNIKKSALGNNTTYHIGDEITYNNQKYNVLYEIDASQDYVPALKQRALSTYEMGYESSDTIQYYSSDNCNVINGNTSGCTNNYDQSFVKDAMDNWAAANFNNSELKSVGGYKVRALMYDELIDNLGYEMGYVDTYSYLMRTENTPEFVYDGAYTPYWIIGNSENEYKAGKLTERYESDSVNNKYKVRPVIFLNKCALGDKDCMVCNEDDTPIYEKKAIYTGKYKAGDILTINNERYIVLKDVLSKTETVKLLKLRLLTLEQINKYNKSEYQSTNGEMLFNIKCHQDEDYEYEHYEECYDYDLSAIKEIVDAWGKDEFKDSYKNSYLITKTELLKLLKYELRTSYTQYGDIIDNYVPTDETPIEITDNDYYSYASNDEMNGHLIVYGSRDIDIFYSTYYDDPANVRPVIEVDKCLLEGGCEYEEIVTGCLTPDGKIIPVEPDPEEIPVENTLSTISKITIIISMIFIVIGLFIFLYNYDKLKKENINKKD